MIKPRKIESWEFYDEEEVSEGFANFVRPGGLPALGEGNRKVAEFFIHTLKGTRRVIDVGCGGGFPSLYVAEYVGDIIGIDAAFNMVGKARMNALKLSISNVSFLNAKGQQLPFKEDPFDGAILCGALEATDEPEKMVQEIYPLLKKGARVACLNEDWQFVMQKDPEAKKLRRFYRKEGKEIYYQYVERTRRPGRERDYRYSLAQNWPKLQEIAREMDLKREHRLGTSLLPEEIPSDVILDIWYDETARLDQPESEYLFKTAGYKDIQSRVAPIWTTRCVLLTCSK